MKNLRFLSFVLIATFLFVSCSSDDGGNNESPYIVLSADAVAIMQGQSVSFTVTDNLNTDVTESATLSINGLTISNPHTFDEGGSFNVTATYNSLTSDAVTIQVFEAGNYFPSNISNFWNYKVNNTSTSNPELNFADETDSISVASVNGNTFTLSANNGLPAFGTMNAIMVGSSLTRTYDMLKIDGTINLPITGFEDFAIDFSNITLYDLNAANNEVLSEESGSISNPYAGGTLTVAYTLTTTGQGNLDNTTVNGETFTNISRSNLNLQILVTLAVEGLTLPLTILPQQDVLSVDNYFAENVGLIKSDSDISYEMDAATVSALQLLGIELGIPASLTVENIQEIDSYSVTE